MVVDATPTTSRRTEAIVSSNACISPLSFQAVAANTIAAASRLTA